MPTVSHRSVTVPLSPFRKLIPLADAAKEAGRHVYHLNIGQPDIKLRPQQLQLFARLIGIFCPTALQMAHRLTARHWRITFCGSI